MIRILLVDDVPTVLNGLRLRSGVDRGFPERTTGNADILDTIQQVLLTLEFVR